jgi:O-antigen ligase
LYLFVASLAFEMPQRSIPVEIPTLTGTILLLAIMLDPRPGIRRIPGALVCFLAFVVAIGPSVATNAVVNPASFNKYMLLLVQAILVFWIASNVLEDEGVARTALGWFVFACALSAALPILGVGRTTYAVWTGGERVVAFGQNPNQRANVLATGFLALIAMIQGRVWRRWWMRLVGWLLLTIIVVGVVQTGSRVGLVILGAGSVVLAVAGSSLATRMRSLVVVLLAVAGLSWSVLNTEVMRNRLKSENDIQTFSGRERIFPALIAMVAERPLTGWGPINNQYEVARRINERKLPLRDAHNLGLELLTSTGLLGAIPFLVGLSLCIRAAWRARVGPHGMLPLALVMGMLVANMSGNHLGSRLFWFVLAYAVASARWPPRALRHQLRPGWR